MSSVIQKARIFVLLGLFFSCFSAHAGLSFNISGSDQRVRPGGQFQVEWVLTNTGPATALNVSVELIYPAGLVRQTAFAMEGATCTGGPCDPGSLVKWSIGNLPSGETRSVYFATSVRTDAANGVLNWDATAFVGSSPAANSIWQQQIDNSAALQLSIDSDRAQILGGETISYSLAYGNTGNSVLNGAILTVPVPGGTTVVAAPGGTISSNSVSWSLGNLSASGAGRRYLTLSIAGRLPGTLLKVGDATLSGTYQGLPRGVTAQHVAVFGDSPLDFELRTQEGTAAPGESQLIEVVVANNSGQVQQNVVVTMLYPTGMSRFNTQRMDGALCRGTNGACDPGDRVTWSIGTLQIGETWSANFLPAMTSGLSPGYPVVWNARVQIGADVLRREQIITLTANTAPELSISSDSSQVQAGERFTWWFNYGNRGSAPLESASLNVPLPPGVSVFDTHGGNAQGNTINWSLGSIPAGVSGRRALTVVAANNLVNGQLIALDRAVLSGLYFGLEQATESEHIVDIGDSPLHAVLRVLPGVVGPQWGTQYEFLVSNRGNTVETGVVLKTLYPRFLNRSNTADMQGAQCRGNTGICDPGDPVVWNFGNLLPGETQSVTFAKTIRSDALRGDSSDWVASILATGTKRRRTDLSVGISNEVLQLSVVSNPTLAVAGQPIDYTFSLGNLSGSLLGNPVLEVPLPEGTQLVSAGGATVQGRRIVWQLDDLPTDTVGKVKLALRVPAATPTGTLVELRNAELSGTLFGIDHSTKVSHTVAVGNSPLSVTMQITPTHAAPGEQLDVNINVVNTGTTVLQNVKFDLLIPYGLNRVSTSAIGPGVLCSGNNVCDPEDHLVWSLGNMLSGATNNRLLSFAPTVRGDFPEGYVMNWQAQVGVVDGKQRRVQSVVGIGSEFDFQLPDVPQKKCAGRIVTVDIGAGQTPTSGPDVILGTNGPDLINASGGNDVVCGLGGNDIILGAGGNDRIFGQGGNDKIYGGNGATDTGDDDLFGGGGNDTIYGLGGLDMIFGQSGNDRLYGSHDRYGQIFGGNDNDRIYVGDAGDFVKAGNGNDQILGSPVKDDISGDAGDDLIDGFDGDDILRGSFGQDTLRGGWGDDILFGEDGNDRLLGNGGDDLLRGGGANDELVGGAGNDSCFGGNGAFDTLASCEVAVAIALSAAQDMQATPPAVIPGNRLAITEETLRLIDDCDLTLQECLARP